MSRAFPAHPFRHAPGSAARRKADKGGRRAATRWWTLVVVPERSGGKIKQISCRAPAGGGQIWSSGCPGEACSETTPCCGKAELLYNMVGKFPQDTGSCPNGGARSARTMTGSRSGLRRCSAWEAEGRTRSAPAWRSCCRRVPE